jgi:hypothetical protein
MSIITAVWTTSGTPLELRKGYSIVGGCGTPTLSQIDPTSLLSDNKLIQLNASSRKLRNI